MSAFLEIDGLERSFGGVRALRGVTLSIERGKTLGLVGENGAGKSTLMNILGGNVRPDRGTMRIEGSPYAPANPKDATRAGIAFVHQELNLFPNLTIAENLFIGNFPKDKNRRAAELLAQVGLDMPPTRKVETLSSGERQLVEIAKALGADARLIIFDEPTTSLSARESERLFALIAKLRERGITIIYISHTLADVFRLSDSIAVLRDGEVVGSGAATDFDLERLVSLMVGRKLTQLFPTRQGAAGNGTILELKGKLQLKRGEVLGIAGLMGAGRTELARAIFGLDRGAEVWLEGDRVDPSPREMIRRGVGFLTENRRGEGLMLEASIAENFTLVSLRDFGRWLSVPKLRELIASLRHVVRLDAKAQDAQPVMTLSGGNQQKVVLGKWLPQKPKALLLDEPTRGVDVGARFELYKLILELADRGTGVLMISSEIEELLGMCDRILVMRRGEFVDELPRAEFNRERILRAALGAKEAR